MIENPLLPAETAYPQYMSKPSNSQTISRRIETGEGVARVSHFRNIVDQVY